MPVLATIGVVYCESPQQNSIGVLVGQFNSSGWDANMKFNAAQGGNFGVFSTNITAGSLMLDNLEMIDGVINDQDIKPAVEANA